MGIVSFCPNGHRVNVKDHLAGRKGICPTCGERFRIPLVSGMPADVGAPVDPQAGLPVAVVVSLDPAVAASLPRAIPLAVSAAPSPRPGPTAAAAPGATEPTAAVEFPHEDGGRAGDAEFVIETEPDATPGIPAAIAEAPDAFWAVAIAGGAPSPTMTATELLEWLASNRPTGEELLWRSDWQDWRPIIEVLPEIESAEHAPEPGPW